MGNLVGQSNTSSANRAKLQASLRELRDYWTKNGVAPWPVPLFTPDPNEPYWLSQPEWIGGWNAFEIYRLQLEPYEWAPPIARICQTISDQYDREESGLNYVMAQLPPNHDLLEEFDLGSNQWFRALYSLLKLRSDERFEGWDDFVSELYDWLGPYDGLRIRMSDVLYNAVTLEWHWRDMSLPEAKQEPIWSFPKAMAWIATRDYLALARTGYFRRPEEEGDEEAVATDGVCKYNTQALGWLHTAITYCHCNCGALREFGWEAFKHCTCISIAWEDLVRFRGGLSPDTPELVFGLQEGWLSMTWPDGADEIRFLRRDILDRWPARPAEQGPAPSIEQSTAAGESGCREWLAEQFASDPEKRRSKGDFRRAAMAAFHGRVSERGFNLRVWPDLAREHGRDGAGAKKKS
ncbi:hypothetical protein OF829_13080 [Sphingomonas sp. LB-2]|uniref:hypothetical protein n=1 Tax=Sphingomonas caeni TaxID=2984949 RepID=UPI002231B52B|nr:hypothetical protein [Sphingomonas caeni]MCW3848173.1 hypothetical protein [Sphingomonas caeni]